MPRPRRARRPPKANRDVAPGPTFPELRGGLIPKAPPRRRRQRSNAASAERLLPPAPDPWPAMDAAAADSLRGYHTSVRGFLLATERSAFDELRGLQEEVRARSGQARALTSLAPIRPHLLRLDGLVDRVATEGERSHRDQGNVAQLAPTRAAVRDLRRAESAEPGPGQPPDLRHRPATAAPRPGTEPGPPR